MYEILSQISGWLSEPFRGMIYSSQIAFVTAIALGIVGSVAPCQLTANLGAITYFTNRQAQRKISWFEVFYYILGKIFVFSVFGILFWAFGQGISNDSIPLFVIMRKLQGPLFIMIGLFLVGLLKLPGHFGLHISNRLTQFANRAGGNKGAFLMGAAFSLGFCPTMFWLFFGLLMPLVLQTSFGWVLPPVFAAGTAGPLLLVLGLYIGFGFDRFMIKKTRKWGGAIQRIAGLFFILLGMGDTFTYWSL